MTNPAPNGPTPNNMPGAQPNTPVFQEPTPPAEQPPAAPAQAEPTAAPVFQEPTSLPPAPQPTPAAPSPAPAPQSPAAAPGAPVPPWEANGEDFNPERAWNLIQNVRGENATLRDQLTIAQDSARQLTEVSAGEQTWRTEAVRAKAEAIASGARFIDAGDALAHLGDLTGFVTGDAIDTTQLTERITQLATDKPYLVAQAATPGFTPNRGQGQSGNGPLTPAQAAAHAESQQDWKSAGTAKAQQLIDLSAAQKK